MIESDDVDVVLVLTSMTGARRARERGARRRASTCWSRSRWRRRSRRPPRSCSWPPTRPGISICAPHILLSPTSAPSARTSRAATSGGCCWRGRATAGRAPTGARWFYERGGGALFDLGVYNVTALCGLFGPRAARHGDGRRRDPRARRRGRGDARAGRGQRARADRLRRGALRVRHDRLHDAEVPLARDRAVRLRRRAAAARRRLGTRGLRALAQRARHLGAVPRERSGLAVDRGAAPPRRLHRGRPRAGDAARACLPRARDHAGGAGGGRRRPRAGDRQRLPAPRPRGARGAAGRPPRPRPALGADPGEVGMARIRMAYIGGGSTRGAGTMASFIHQGENFDGSEVVLDRPRSGAARPDPPAVRAHGQGARARPHDRGDDRSPRGPHRLRCDSLELSPRRLRGARPGREDPARARHHRPGDAGAGRLLHGAARDPRHAGDPRRRRGRLPEGADLQLHEPGQRPGAGRDDALGRAVRLALRGPDLLRRPDRQGLRTSTARSWRP